MNITQQEFSSMTETKLSGGLKEGGILKKKIPMTAESTFD